MAVRRHSQVRRGLCPGVLAFLKLLTVASLPCMAEAARTGEHWEIGRPVAIEVNHGHADFGIPTTNRTDKSLIIVSALAPREGPFAARLRVTSSHDAGPLPGHIVGNLSALPVGFVAHARQKPAAPPSRPPQPRRTFHIMVRPGEPARAENYLAVGATLSGHGDRIQVYTDDRDAAQVTDATVSDLLRTFEEEVLPTASRLWGPAEDVDHDGRLTVLLTSWLDRLGGSHQGVDGLFRGADYVGSLAEPFSNHCDMLYLSPRMGPGPHLRTVLAHEYAHAVNFSRKCLGDRRSSPTRREEDGWLDEAVAHLVEDLHGFSRSNLDHRVNAFLSSPERYRLVVSDYYQANLFRSHGHRGSAYLFLRWCSDQFGPELLGRLIASDLTGIANVEAATGVPFAELYRRWSIDLYMAGLRSGCVPADGPILAGPRATFLSPDGPVGSWTFSGTTSHFALVEGSPNGAVHVEVEGDLDAQLQVTAIKLPPDLPRLDLSARFVAGPASGDQLRLVVRERDGTGVRLRGLSWEAATIPADGRGTVPVGEEFRGERLRSVLGSRDLEPNETLRSTPIPIEEVTSRHGPVLLKLVGVDARGRRVEARARVDTAVIERSD